MRDNERAISERWVALALASGYVGWHWLWPVEIEAIGWFSAVNSLTFRSNQAGIRLVLPNIRLEAGFFSPRSPAKMFVGKTEVG